MTRADANLPPILPVGTAVVTRVEVRSGEGLTCPAGAVGTIIRSPADPEHSDRVRLELHEQFNAVSKKTDPSGKPDCEAGNASLARARRSMVKTGPARLSPAAGVDADE